MDARQYLRQTTRMNEIIDSKLAEIKRLRELSTSLPSPSAPKSTPSGKSKAEASYTRCIQRIIDLEATVDREIDELVDFQRDVRDAIDSLQDPDERLLLRLRYVNGITWEQIADKMHYTLRQVYRIHENALKNIEIPDIDPEK